MKQEQHRFTDYILSLHVHKMYDKYCSEYSKNFVHYIKLCNRLIAIESIE